MPTQSPAPDEAAQPFPAITHIQAAHLELIPRVDAIERGQEPASLQEVEQLLADMREFQRRVVASGSLIDNPADRELAQSILDFWGIREGYMIRRADQLKVASDDGLEEGGRSRGGRPPPDLPEPQLLTPFDESKAPHLDDALRPFVGLSAFSEQDASRRVFYGREEAVSELVSRIAEGRLVLISGPSGSGKSSLIMAGLIPSLRGGGAPGSESWTIWPPVLPGPDPVTALLLAVRPADSDPKTWVDAHKEQLVQSPDALSAIVAEAGGGTAPSLLIVDQAEELVSMTNDPVTQNAFAAALVALTRLETPANRVLLVVREDFVERLLMIPAFKDLPAPAEVRYRPKPLTAAELQAAIVGPAQAVGLTFEPGIVEDLVREVINDPAALPLLQFTLAQMWAKRRRNKITRGVYEAVGTPNQALGRTAEEVYTSLNSVENQHAAREIFMALVVPSVGKEYVRRRVRRETLHQLLDKTRIDRVLDAFVSAGLIRVTPGITDDDDRFEVMHEALLRNWPRLAEWLEEVRRKDQRKLFVLNAARLWSEAGHLDDHLAVGEALAEARQYADRDELIAKYVEASALAERRRTEADQQRYFKVRRWFVGLAAVVVIALALVPSVILYTRIERERAAEKQSQAAEEIATARREQERAESDIAEADELRQRILIEAEGAVEQVQPTSFLPVSTGRDGPGETGFMWIGTERSPLLREADGKAPVTPSDIMVGTGYRARINITLRSRASTESVAAGRQTGVVPPGALVVAMAKPTVHKRPSGEQHWLEVRLVPRVFIQSPEETRARANDLRGVLRDVGYEVPAPEALSSASGLSEVRYFFAQDREPAERLVREINGYLSQRSLPARMRAASFSGREMNAVPGTLEVWWDGSS